MKKRNLCFAMTGCALMAAICACVSPLKNGKVEIVGLTVDRLVTPQNIVKPTFAWKMRSTRKGASQVGAVIRLFEQRNDGKNGGLPTAIWSKSVPDSTSVGVRYDGPALKSGTEYLWLVDVTDESGNVTHSEMSYFRTGLLNESEWADAKWISVPNAPIATKEDDRDNLAAPGTSVFVKKFAVAGKVKSAYIATSGLGVYEIYMNGRKIGCDALKPGFTHNGKTKYSFTYDVRDMLKVGDGNVIAAEVSSGWWRDRVCGYSGKKSALRAKLFVTYEDGTKMTVATDVDWLSAIAGPVKSAGIFDGETYDARESRAYLKGEELEKFAKPEICNDFKGEVLPMVGPAIKRRMDIALEPKAAYVWKGTEGANENEFGKVVKLRDVEFGKIDGAKLAPGETLVVDFGQNAAAVPMFTAVAAAGTVMTILPAEMLNDGNGAKARGNDGPEGSVYRVNLREAYRKGTRVVYTFAGNGNETFVPEFTFLGYRYASITATGDVEIKRIVSVPVTSINKTMELGSIRTGNTDVNQLISNVLWGQYSNYLSVPTDCPQRNERQGWMADTQVFTKAAMFNADVYPFIRKFARDMRDTQVDGGSYTGVAPVGCYGAAGVERLGWSDCGIIAPYNVWLWTGDTTILEESWASMSKFMDWLAVNRYAKDAALSYQWADWLSYEKYESCSGKFREGGRISDGAAMLWKYLGGCYWLWDAQMMSEMATALGKDDDAVKYAKMADEALEYLRANFLDGKGMLSPLLRNMQTPALFAIKFGVVEGAAFEATKSELLSNIAEHGDCLQTGFLGTSILMDTLTDEANEPAVAYTLLLQHKNPSWLYSVDQGATTIWERWNSYRKDTGFGPVGMNSFNHYAYGAVLEWMYRAMAGIREDKSQPGYHHFFLKPMFDRRIVFVDAKYDAAYGEIKSAWIYEVDGSIKWNFTIPANTSATVVLGDKTEELSAGTYTRTIAK